MDKYRRFKVEGKENIDAIADILEGQSGDGPVQPLMDLVNEFRMRPTPATKLLIDQWLTQIATYIEHYRAHMDERLKIK